MSEAVFVQGLTKTYGGKTVVDHLNLSVSSGTVFGLLGANGAGKSTTIECMLGTKEADAGTVRLLGQDPKKHRRMLFERIGVQFQSGDYQKEIKVSELCEETASLYRAPADWRKLCGQFGIGELRKQAIRMNDEPVSFAFFVCGQPADAFFGMHVRLRLTCRGKCGIMYVFQQDAGQEHRSVRRQSATSQAAYVCQEGMRFLRREMVCLFLHAAA